MEFDEYKTGLKDCVERFQQYDQFMLAKSIKGLTNLITLFSGMNAIVSGVFVMAFTGHLSGNEFFLDEIHKIFGEYSKTAFLVLTAVTFSNFVGCKFQVEKYKEERNIAYLFLGNRVEGLARTSKSFPVGDYHANTKEAMKL